MGCQIRLKNTRIDEGDYSSSRNDFGGYDNAPNTQNLAAFATLSTDGSITAWGNPNKGGSGAPTDNGYTKIYSTNGVAFAAVRNRPVIGLFSCSTNQNHN